MMKYSKFEQRVSWLLEHRALWKRKRSLHDRNQMTAQAHKVLVAAMKRAGLFAPSTFYLDCPLKAEIYGARVAVEVEKWNCDDSTP